MPKTQTQDAVEMPDVSSPPLEGGQTRGAAERSVSRLSARSSDAGPAPLFGDYAPLPSAYDEMFKACGTPRSEVADVVRMFDALGQSGFRSRKRMAEAAMLRGGVTFTVYGDKQTTERIFPFDPIPRLVAAKDWQRTEAGLEQRIRALNLFLADVYGAGRIMQEGIVPRAAVESSKGFLPQLRGVTPPGGVYVHVAGIDLIRDPAGNFIVLEDNLRSPSGVSYVIENRAIMKRVLMRVFGNANVRPVDAYPTHLLDSLLDCLPVTPDTPRVVVLTPGPYNSAYFEHSFLAHRMGCDLVIPNDLFVEEDRVYLKTTAGPVPVDVIYRRIDDEFIDPDAFRPDSMLGVRGLVGAYRAGNVVLANALGNGVADDKAIYPYVPEMIRFYLSEEPLLGQVPTLCCSDDKDRARVLEDPAAYVVKSVDASGGYGMVMGPSASRATLAALCDSIRAQPRSYIAQPLIELSTCPTWTGERVEARRVDLRPYVLTGRRNWTLPGGLTRVALTEGSYVVNSSQGGGSKDTWIVDES